MTDDKTRFHEHSFTLAPIGENALGVFCPCGHTVVPDGTVPEGEAVRAGADVTKVGLVTFDDLNKLRTPFQSEEFFPLCPVRAIRNRDGES